MSKSKEELESKIRQLEEGLNRLLLTNRIQWLSTIFREAKLYDFSSIGELIAFIVDHAEEIQNADKEVTD